MKEIVLGVARHILGAIGAVLATKGFVDEATWQTIIGAVITAASAVWSIFEKLNRPAE